MSSVFLFLLTILLTSFSPFSAGDQTVRISESSISRQIHQPTITAIYRDKRGYLWIGTQHGLYKHDGSRLTLFNSEQSNRNWIPVSDIRGIAEPSEGGLLIATFGGGFLRWNSDTNSFEQKKINSYDDAKYLSNVVTGGKNTTWIIGKEGAFLYTGDYHSSNLQFEISRQLAEETGKVSAVVSNIDGTTYIASGANLYEISSQGKLLERINWKLDNTSLNGTISALALDDLNRLYIGTDDGHLFGIKLSDYSRFASQSIGEKSSASISSILVSEKTVWVGTTDGLFQFDESLSLAQVFRHDNSELSNNYITAIANDDNLIWIGTYHGLNIISAVHFQTFDERNSGVFDDVLAFTQDNLGRIWVGTYNGLYFQDRSIGSHLNFSSLSKKPLINDQRIMTIASKDKELWVGFQKDGVQVINIETGAVTTPEIPGSHDLEVTKILHTGDTETWLATYNRGLYSIKDGEVTSHLDDASLPEVSITILLELDSGALLASSEQKMYLYDRKERRFKLLNLEFENSTQPPLILSLSQSSSGDIWLGTKDQGLFIWPAKDQIADKPRLRNANQDSEMSSSTIYAIQFDREGNAWCSTQRGIVKFDQHGRFLARFTSVDGLQGDDFNFGASFTDNQGRMYFGGSNGYSRFTPKQVDIDATPPRLSLNKIDISSHGEVLSYDATDLQTLELGHEDQHVRFDFGVLDFLDPDKNQYRHKLEGLDRDWIDTGTRNSTSYTDLPAGKYVLKVQGANSAGVWNRESLSLKVSVAPPPWQTWWAYCFYSVLLMLLFWLWKRAYDSYAIERRATQLAVEKHEAAELADDEMQEQLEMRDDFVRSVYQHNVELLTLVKDVIAAQSETIADFSARQLAGSTIKRVTALALLEDCLYHEHELLLADLHKYTDIMVSRLLQDSPVPEETITTINEVSSSHLPIGPAAPLAIALYEMLENSIQHAFKDEALANYVHITLTVEYLTEQRASRYCLTVQDNGRGLPDDVDPQARETAGMAILHTMAERLAGSLSCSTQKGTTISLTFTYQERL